MISLTNNSSATTQKLQAFLSGAAATTNPTVTVVSYIVPPQSKDDFSENRRAPQFTVLAGATETDIADAPPQGSVKDIIYIACVNPDTAVVTISFVIDDNATNRLQFKAASVPVGGGVYYDGTTGGRGWYVTDANGGIITNAQVTLTYGTYTPTQTGVTNVTANTAYLAQYYRVGDMVTVSGKSDVNATGAADTELGVSLPIASNFTAEQQCGGTGAGAVGGAAALRVVAINADATNDRAQFRWFAPGAGNTGYYWSFTYRIL